jgi:glucose/arabinose dehydrogenase
VEHGKQFFLQNCAICHSAGQVTAGRPATGQGPSLEGVAGRRAGSLTNFNYSKALSGCGLVWDGTNLDRFLSNPMSTVPGTSMMIVVGRPEDRRDLIAFLGTVKAPVGGATLAEKPAPATTSPETDPGHWRNAAPGVKHHLSAAALAAPYATRSAGNGPKVVPAPADAALAVPPGFTVKQFAAGFSNPRLMRVAPNGDIFIAETGARRIRVLRAADGADAPAENQIFAENLDRPFGIAFYPPGDAPEWVYVANNNSVVRIPYQAGDLKARGEAGVIVPSLSGTTGGHSTRDVAFSKDGKRMFVSVGSASNVGEGMGKKTPEEIQAWEAEHGLGAAWGFETHRADVLVTDPEGKAPLKVFAAGIRNGVGLAVNPETGDLWTATNERDGLGDDLVPDYITRVREGAFYGWPWYYLGSHEDPRHAGVRPDLAGKATVPDVLLQAHSAALELTFYTGTNGVAAFPAEYRGDVFACLHGSWNRTSRTGYKVIRAKLNHGIPTGEYEDFMTGFVVDDRSVWGRPVGVAVARDGALLVAEDGNGTLWRVSYRKP